MKKRKTKAEAAIGMDHRRVGPILFRNYLVSAIADGSKSDTRRLVLPNNSRVIGVPADTGLDGVDLETGRGSATGDIRARRQFENGQVRVVPVTSLVRPHDLFWIRPGRTGARKHSEWTLEVVSVEGRRLQDMTNADALREGITSVPDKIVRKANDLSARSVFIALWNDICKQPGTTWADNPWVWIYRFHAYPHNIDSAALAKALRT